MFGSQKINLHEYKKEFLPKAQNVQPGSADLCFLAESDVADVLHALQKANIEVTVWTSSEGSNPNHDPGTRRLQGRRKDRGARKDT